MTKQSNRPSTGRGMPGWLIWAGAAVVVVVVLVAAVAFSSDDDGPPIEDETGALSVGDKPTSTGDEGAGQGSAGETTTESTQAEPAPDSLPVVGEDGTDTAIGMQLPSLHGTDLITGEDISITDDGRGKVIVVMAHWCPHCQREIPAIVEHLDGQAPADVDIYGVSTAVDPSASNYPPSSWLEGEGWDFPTIADSQDRDAYGALGASGFPYFVVVDPSNEVVARTSGEIPMDAFDQLLAMARGSVPLS